MKIKCTKCGEEKELSHDNFYKTDRNQTGFVTQCKECMNRKQKVNNAKESSKQNWTKLWIG